MSGANSPAADGGASGFQDYTTLMLTDAVDSSGNLSTPYIDGTFYTTPIDLNSTMDEADRRTDDEINQDIYHYYIINGVIMSVVAAFGLIGNVISLIILRRPELRSPINVYLFWRGYYDIVLIVTSVTGFGLPSIYGFTGVQDSFTSAHPYMVQVIYPVALIAQTASVWLTVTVTVERYIAVCHPLKSRGWCTMRKAKISIAIVSLLSILYNIPKCFETEVAVWYPPTNGTVEGINYIRKTAFREDKTYISVYYIYMYIPIMTVIPFLALSILNTMIWLAVQKAKKERSQMSRSREKEMNTALMLVVIVVVFILCNIMAAVVNCIENASTDDDNTYRISNTVVYISNLLVTVNSSVNFLIYCIFGKKFRLLFLKIFCRFCLKRERYSPDYSIAYRSTSLVKSGMVFNQNSPRTDNHYASMVTLQGEDGGGTGGVGHGGGGEMSPDYRVNNNIHLHQFPGSRFLGRGDEEENEELSPLRNSTDEKCQVVVNNSAT